ncbi:MAG: sterol desaturase family protein [Burkholderiaceae bacterium]
MNDTSASDAAVQLYLGALIFSLVAVFLLESLRPARAVGADAPRRWAHNLLLAALATLTTLYTPLLFAVVFQALGAEPWGFRGLLARVEVPAWLAWVATFMVLDVTGYTIHRLAHAVPWFWRLHAIHHSDLEMDATTTHRHHPLENLATAALTLPVLLLLGAPPLAVLGYSVAVTVFSTFSHANLTLGPRVDGWLGRLLVTPDFHRMHHSAERRFTDSNYGMLLPWWDHLFGTASAPAHGDEARRMQLGLEYFRQPTAQRLDRMLLQPFGHEGFDQARAEGRSAAL